MAKRERLEALIKHYSNGKPSIFAKYIGVAPSTISSWLSRDTLDYDLLFAKCENISSEWLLTGNGEMFRGEAIIIKQESIEDKLLSVIQNKDDIIRKLDNKIGRLENEIEHLKEPQKFGRPDAEAAGVASVG